jgi:hypothetical protein
MFSWRIEQNRKARVVNRHKYIMQKLKITKMYYCTYNMISVLREYSI